MPVVLDLKSIKQNPYIKSSFTPPRHPHSHVFFEISFCVTGHAINTINGTPVPFQNGSCVILRPGDVHQLTEYDEKIYEHIDIYATTKTFKKLCDCCDPNLYDSILNYGGPISFTLSPELFSYMFNQSLRLKEMIVNGDEFFQTLHICLLSTVLSEWIRHKSNLQDYKPNWLKNLLPQFNSVSFLQKNVTQIAAEAGFSLPYFSTQFRKYMGVSAIEYLTKKRVHASKSLLVNDKLRIIDISGMLGFENPSTFSKHFLHEFKISPKEYRKNYQKNSLI